MKVKLEHTGKDKVELNVTAGAEYLAGLEADLVAELSKSVKVPGFRTGTAPAALARKYLDASRLQDLFLDRALNELYAKAIDQENLRPLDRPEAKIAKFVPFTALEVTYAFPVIGEIKLADYKKLKSKPRKVKIDDKDVARVIENLRRNLAERKPLKRPAKTGDELIIDFNGYNDKGEPLAGASGKAYPLLLGSKTFIPGFETALLGAKAGESREFEITFPNDYHQKSLAGRKAKFKVKVTKVNRVILPKVDDAFAKKVGPQGSLSALKKDIRSQLLSQKMREADERLKNDLIKELVEKSDIPVPKLLLDDQLKHLKEEFVNDLAYRGITLKEYLKQQETDEHSWEKDSLMPRAKLRVKSGLAISEIARRERIDVSEQELDARIQLLKAQYRDPQMAAQFETPSGRRHLENRMITEKVLEWLVRLNVRPRK